MGKFTSNATYSAIKIASHFFPSCTGKKWNRVGSFRRRAFDCAFLLTLPPAPTFELKPRPLLRTYFLPLLLPLSLIRSCAASVLPECGVPSCAQSVASAHVEFCSTPKFHCDLFLDSDRCQMPKNKILHLLALCLISNYYDMLYYNNKVYHLLIFNMYIF